MSTKKTLKRIMCRLVLMTVVLATNEAVSQAQGPNLIANGDFSANASLYVAYPGYSGSGNPVGPTGWTTPNSSYSGINGYDTNFTVFLDNNYSPNPLQSWPSTSGRTVKDFYFQQYPGGSIEQHVLTTSQHIYSVTFDATTRAVYNPGDWSVTMGSATYDTGAGLSASQWQGYGFSVIASGSATNLTFTSESVSQNLANVSVADISGLWNGDTSGNLGGADKNFADGNFSFGTASNYSNGTLYFNDTDGTGGIVGNTTLTTVAGGVSAGTLQFNNSAVNYSINSADATGITGATALLKNGTGTLTLGGTNTYSGTTTVNAGTLAIGSPLALQNSTLVINGPGTVSFGSLTGAVLGGLQGSNALALQNASAAAVAITIGSNNAGTTYSGMLYGAGGLTKTGSGTTILAGPNTYTGATSVQSGLLVLQGNNQSSSFTATSGGTLEMAGNMVNLSYQSLTAQAGGTVEYKGATINGGYLHGPGTHVTLSGGTSNFNGVTTFNSTVFQQNGPTIFTNFTNGGQLSNGAPMTWNGGTNASSGQVNVNAACNVQDFTNNGVVIVNSGGTLNNAVSDLVGGGGGEITINPGGQLNANSDGSGSAIDLRGSLLVNNGAVTGTTNVYFGSLAQGSGTYGPVNLYNGGQFKPGNSPGSVTTGSATWNSGGQYLVEINDATGTAGTNWNLWNINGSLALGAGTTPNSKFNLVLESGSSEAPGMAADFDNALSYQWPIAEANGGISGFSPADISIDSAGFANNLGGGTFSVSQVGSAIDLNFTPVPETSTLTLLAAGAIAIVGFGWRRRTTLTAGPAPLHQHDAQSILPFTSRSPAGVTRRAA